MNSTHLNTEHQDVGYAPRIIRLFNIPKPKKVRGAYPTGLWPVLEFLGLLETLLSRMVFTASPILAATIL